ncbi:MAG: FAD-binding oxidoreductase, partial [Chloroflexota bacterium]|nr:FAD-binding oxidoreductase [Chloroflexota bacterium]
MSDDAEVVVIGAGIVGAAVARELAVRGVDTLLLDRAGVADGTTGRGEGNVIVADKAPGPELALAMAGQALYDELEARLGAAIRIRRHGCLVVYETDAARQAGER